MYLNDGWFCWSKVVIDFDNNRIINAHSTDRYYDYHRLIYSFNRTRNTNNFWTISLLIAIY